MRNIPNRKTIEDVIYTEGIGIHSGKIAKLRLVPADLNTGIVFINKKYGMKSPIRVSPEAVIDTNFAITLSNSKWQVCTVEHLLSFFYIYGISDIIVEVDGNEIPIYDGSVQPLISLFSEKKLFIYEEINEPLVISNPIWIFDDDKHIIALPSEEPMISYTIHHNHPLIKTQFVQINLTKESYIKEIASARTYGFSKDSNILYRNSRSLGASLNNTLVFSEDSCLNDLRFEDECVRHKILDFIGGISLLGKPIIGHFIIAKSGHTFDFSFIKKVKDIYSNIEIGNKVEFIKKAKHSL